MTQSPREIRTYGLRGTVSQISYPVDCLQRELPRSLRLSLLESSGAEEPIGNASESLVGEAILSPLKPVFLFRLGKLLQPVRRILLEEGLRQLLVSGSSKKKEP